MYDSQSWKDSRTTSSGLIGNIGKKTGLQPAIAGSKAKTGATVVKMIMEIDIDDQKFRTWLAHQFPFLASLILPPGTEVF